jgi:HPt (histidine-containing phosphotransfer) domain-containing protein
MMAQSDPSIAAAMRELAGDDEEFIVDLLETYVSQAEEVIAQIRGAAHLLAGASMNVGADRAAALCRSIELDLVADLAAEIAGIRAGL